ncbi:MAG: hypothetical protein IPL61_01010 [Myxococcales bacterium]|nr:hypothetical protein [Myxococcales bacterium]
MTVAARALRVLALAGLVACSREAAPRPPVDNRGGAAAPLDAGARDAGDSACVNACVRDRQMVATSIEAIEASCRRDCASPPPRP